MAFKFLRPKKNTWGISQKKFNALVAQQRQRRYAQQRRSVSQYYDQDVARYIKRGGF